MLMQRRMSKIKMVLIGNNSKLKQQKWLEGRFQRMVVYLQTL